MGNSTEYRNATSSEVFNLATVIIFCSLNILLSITASVGNILILIALRKVTSLHSPTKLLFQCLAITDLGVGLISQPLYAIFIFLINFNLWNIISILHDITWGLSICLSGVSVLTTTALSVDRILALLLKLRYRHVVTLKRVRAVVFCFWLIALSSNFMFLFWDTNIALTAISVLVMLCIVTSLLSYTIIFIKLRLHQATVHPTVQCDVHHHGQPTGGGIAALRIAQFKRTVTSIGLVQSALVVCYIPFVIVNAILLLNNVVANLEVFGMASNLVYSTLVYLNSSLNPFLYCWRIKEVRQAVKATIKQLYCNCLRWVPYLGDRSMEKQSDCKIAFQSNEYILKEGLTRDIIADNMVHNNRLFHLLWNWFQEMRAF